MASNVTLPKTDAAMHQEQNQPEVAAYLKVLETIIKHATSPLSIEEIASKCMLSGGGQFKTLEEAVEKIPIFNKEIANWDDLRNNDRIKMIFVTQTPIDLPTRQKIRKYSKPPMGLIVAADHTIVKFVPASEKFGPPLHRENETKGHSDINPIPWAYEEIEDLLIFIRDKTCEDLMFSDLKIRCSQFKFSSNSRRTVEQFHAKAFQYISNGLGPMIEFPFKQQMTMFFFLRIPPNQRFWAELYKESKFQADEYNLLTYCALRKYVLGNLDKSRPLSVPGEQFFTFLKIVATTRFIPLTTEELADEFLAMFPYFDSREKVIKDFQTLTYKDVVKKVSDGILQIRVFFVSQIPVSKAQLTSFKHYGKITFQRMKISSFETPMRDLVLKKPKTARMPSVKPKTPTIKRETRKRSSSSAIKRKSKLPTTSTEPLLRPESEFEESEDESKEMPTSSKKASLLNRQDLEQDRNHIKDIVNDSTDNVKEQKIDAGYGSEPEKIEMDGTKTEQANKPKSDDNDKNNDLNQSNQNHLGGDGKSDGSDVKFGRIPTNRSNDISAVDPQNKSNDNEYEYRILTDSDSEPPLADPESESDDSDEEFGRNLTNKNSNMALVDPQIESDDNNYRGRILTDSESEPPLADPESESDEESSGPEIELDKDNDEIDSHRKVELPQPTHVQAPMCSTVAEARPNPTRDFMRILNRPTLKKIMVLYALRDMLNTDDIIRAYKINDRIDKELQRDVSDEEEISLSFVLDATKKYYRSITRKMSSEGSLDYLTSLHSVFWAFEDLLKSLQSPLFEQLITDAQALRRLSAIHAFKINRLELNEAMRILVRDILIR